MATATASKPPTAPAADSGYKDRPWIPRFWDGMVASVWFRIVLRNRLAVHPRRIAMLLIISVISVINSALAAIQWVFYSWRIRRTKIEEDPIFIIGHWRSGTTLLHEYLVLDPRHTYPSTYQCFAPSHFLLTGKVLPALLKFLLPDRRPMDNMPAGWNHPQEDEFALCNLGAPSPYLGLIFPNRPPVFTEYLDFEGVPRPAIERWKRKFLWFLKCLTLWRPKRIVLKSPPHTARIKALLELFPKARFVHIVRDPYVVFPSTKNLWKRLSRDQGLQVPNGNGMDEYVFTTFNRMYDVFHRDQKLIDPSRYCEVRYEELVADPVGQMRTVYERLGLGGFEGVRPALEQYVAGQKGYQTNRYEIAPEIKAEIARRWRGFFQRYGYPER
jgi:omega-hydroxy-beta-dihydromenaquinone-9 sulfotransferase